MSHLERVSLALTKREVSQVELSRADSTQKDQQASAHAGQVDGHSQRLQGNTQCISAACQTSKTHDERKSTVICDPTQPRPDLLERPASRSERPVARWQRAPWRR